MVSLQNPARTEMEDHQLKRMPSVPLFREPYLDLRNLTLSPKCLGQGTWADMRGVGFARLSKLLDVHLAQNSCTH